MKEDFKRFEDWKPPILEENVPTKWNWVVQHIDQIKLGYKCDIGAFTYINAKHGVNLGPHVQIGSHCSIYTISTIDKKIGSINIEENAKVGSHSVIMPGVTIGKNAIIGAFSFVNKDVPENSVAYGVPIEIVNKKRDDKSI